MYYNEAGHTGCPALSYIMVSRCYPVVPIGKSLVYNFLECAMCQKFSKYFFKILEINRMYFYIV